MHPDDCSVKRLVAAWRVLVGVWAPKRWDMSFPAVAQYTVPRIPPENPWVDRSKAKLKSRPLTPSASDSPSASSDSTASPSPPKPSEKRHRPPSRRLIRHVLRARVEAAKALASLFVQLGRAPDGKRVCASVHLAHAYGGQVDMPDRNQDTKEGVEARTEPIGWRSAREVVAFLRARGAKFRALESPAEGDWAALSSDGEGYDSDSVSSSREDDIVWVPPGQH